MNGLTIGKLARKTGVGIETVRFYERQGLIAPPPRTDSNYRIYPHEEVARLRFIRRGKQLGFTLNEIKELMGLRADPNATKADIKAKTLVKIEDITQKIDDLSRIKEALQHLADSCSGHGALDECPILDALDANEDECRGH